MIDQYKLVPVEPTPEMLKSAVQRELVDASHYGRLRDTYRTMLAAAPQPSAEPVAWGNFKEDGTLVGLSQYPEDQTNWAGRKPLYTHPQPAKRKPLTEEAIDKLDCIPNVPGIHFGDVVDFARAIERAHGIGGQK